jgi:hypothetical protein
MGMKKRCKYIEKRERCPNDALAGSNYCRKHKKDGSGSARTPWDVIKDGIAIERAAELGKKVWEKIEEIIRDFPGLSAQLTAQQLKTIKALSTERSAEKRKALFDDLVKSLTRNQKLALVGVVALALASTRMRNRNA